MIGFRYRFCTIALQQIHSDNKYWKGDCLHTYKYMYAFTRQKGSFTDHVALKIVFSRHNFLFWTYYEKMAFHG